VVQGRAAGLGDDADLVGTVTGLVRDLGAGRPG
jgi:hypothetical protein